MKQIFTPHQKAIIALEALKGQKNTGQLCTQYEAHPSQIGIWKKQVVENAHLLFSDKRKNEEKDQQDLIDRLYRIIGQRDIELEWLKKKLHVESS